MTQMPEQDRAATTAMPAQGGKQLQAEGLGMPADSQVISYQYLTRAKHSLAHITIDELEQNMPLPNEQLIPLEEGEEYENFLEALQNNFDELPEDDEEDIDFVLDELLFNSDLDENVPVTPQKGTQHSARAPCKKVLRSCGNAELLGHMSGFADASDVPDAVLGVPACMIPEGAQHMVCVDQDYQHMYEQHQGVPPAWVSQPVSGPVGFGSNQVKQLYRQLNHHCQLMIQIYALTAPNRQHQQTAHTVKELLDTYQAVTLQVLNVGIEQMPHGKLYDQPYLPELLGTVDACNPQAETSPDTSPSQRPPSQHQGNESRAAAQPSSATQGQPCSALVAVSQQVSQGGQTISTGAGTDLPVQHQGHDCSQSQQDQQQQSGPSSQVTLTQPDVTAAAAAEVTSVAQQAQHQGQQQDYPNQEHHQQYQQHQQQQQHQHRGSAADHGTVAMQVESTSVLQQARNGPQNTVAGASSGPSSPAKDNSRIGSADAGSQATWAPFADFDVYSILEVAPMKLLQDFYTDMAQVPVSAEAVEEPAAPTTQRKSKKANRLPPPYVPAEVKQAVAHFADLFDPALFPKFQALPAQMTWTQGEDELLATGLLRYGQDWVRINQHIMPNKTTAKEYITRPLEAEEVAAIDRGLQYLEDNWEVQRHLEDAHALQDSSHDARMQHMNRWRLLPYVPFLGLQSRGGLVLYQMYDEATGKKSKTTRTGAAPGALDKKPKATKAAPIQPAFQADAASPDNQQKKKHGGSRQVVLDPPVYLLFDEPSNISHEDGAAVIAGRAARTRRPADDQISGRQRVRRKRTAKTNSQPRAQVEVAEGVPAYPLDPNYLAGYPVTEPIVSAVHTQPVLALYPPPSNPVQLANPFRVHLSEDPSQHVQQLLHSASQAVHNFRTEGFQAYEWQAQQQPISTMQVVSHQQPAPSSPYLPPVSAAFTTHEAQQMLSSHSTPIQPGDSRPWLDDPEQAPHPAANDLPGANTPDDNVQSADNQHGSQQKVSPRQEAPLQQHASLQQDSSLQSPSAAVQDRSKQISSWSGVQQMDQSELMLQRQASAQPQYLPPAAAKHNSRPADTAQQEGSLAGMSQSSDAQLAQTSVISSGPQKPAAASSHGDHPTAPSGSQAQATSSQGGSRQLEQIQLASMPEVGVEEEFEQDRMSQPATSEEDEDFEPDYLSQPESTTDDAFELDEAMSQPSDTESDDINANAQQAMLPSWQPASALCTDEKQQCLAQQPQQPASAVGTDRKHQHVAQQSQQAASAVGTDSKHQHATPAAAHSTPLQGLAAKLKLAAPSGSGRQGLKRPSRQQSPEAQQMPAAKRQAMSPEWEQGPQRRQVLHTARQHKVAELHMSNLPQPTSTAAAVSTKQMQHSGAGTSPAAAAADAGRQGTTANQQNQDRQPWQEPQATAGTAPVSYRKRPRKATRPKCSGPVFCTPPEPPDSPPPVKSPAKIKGPQPGTEAATVEAHQLRPREDGVGRWATKRPRHPRKPKHRGAHHAVMQDKVVAPAAVVRSSEAIAADTLGRAPVSAVDRGQATSDAACLVDGVVPVSVSQMFVDGVHTEWSSEHDRAVLLVCVIQHQGHPAPEVLNELVQQLQQLGGKFTVRQVQARFQLLLHRFLQNSKQQP